MLFAGALGEIHFWFSCECLSMSQGVLSLSVSQGVLSLFVSQGVLSCTEEGSEEQVPVTAMKMS